MLLSNPVPYTLEFIFVINHTSKSILCSFLSIFYYNIIISTHKYMNIN